MKESNIVQYTSAVGELYTQTEWTKIVLVNEKSIPTEQTSVLNGIWYKKNQIQYGSLEVYTVCYIRSV